jgi:two-component system, LytTR family, sensor histidine kinase AgrC
MRERLNFKKIIFTSIAINAVQVSVILGIILYNLINRAQGKLHWNLEFGEILLLIVIITVFISSFFTIKNLYNLSFISSEQGMLKSTLEELEMVNRTLRGQRHDFINNLQVVYSLIEMDEYAEAKDYIEKVYDDIQKVNKILKTSNPAVNALLQAKLIYSEKKNIKMDINITTQLSTLVMPSWEFCRILGNIIDNAMYALETVNGYRCIKVEIFESLKVYGFSISNNGPKIPSTLIDKIFDNGFTTKGENGQGMGLAITREIMLRYGGNTRVKSDDSITVFEGWMPKQLEI